MSKTNKCYYKTSTIWPPLLLYPPSTPTTPTPPSPPPRQGRKQKPKCKNTKQPPFPLPLFPLSLYFSLSHTHTHTHTLAYIRILLLFSLLHDLPHRPPYKPPPHKLTNPFTTLDKPSNQALETSLSKQSQKKEMELLSQMWSLLGLLTVLQNILPSQLLSLLHSLWQSLQDSLTPYSYFDVPEFLGSSSVTPNPLYRHAHLYLHHHRSLLLLSSPPPRLTLSGPGPGPCHSLSLSPGHSVADSFDGHRLLWTLHADTLNDSLEERRSFTLRLPKHHSSALLQPYLSHLSASASAFDASSRDRRIHTNTTFHTWSSVPFRHPATFDTLALDPDLKSFLVSDIEAFSKAGEFYRRIGRPWKRGYLLYGPPGSGKSSLIAAIANCLNYDVFDLELTRVANNSDLRSLLIQTTNRSVIVIEDIDCSLHLTGDRSHKKRRLHANSSSDDHDSDDDVNIEKDNNSRSNNSERVTLSGLLNFTDGLWSCCGDERIIIFTTNYKDGVDEALLRAGRMDVHVRLGECGVHAMREMVERYIGVAEEVKEMVGVAESCIRAGAAMTPAEIGEVLMRSREDRVAAVRELVGELQARIVGGDGSEGEEEVSSPGGKGTKRKGWEGRVRFLGRLKSLTKSDSGRRGV